MNPATRATAATATPQHFVPFDVTHEHAEQLVREYVKGAEYLPKGFDPSFNQLRAMYVPFYVYDVFVYGETGFVSYKVVQVSRGINAHLHYALRIKGHGEFSGVFVDATGRMPDGLAQSVAPFDFDGSKLAVGTVRRTLPWRRPRCRRLAPQGWPVGSLPHRLGRPRTARLLAELMNFLMREPRQTGRTLTKLSTAARKAPC